jgi:hypothetical protein
VKMSHFNDLRGNYSAWRETQNDYARESMQFAQMLANEFKRYIGAPDSFDDLESKRPVRYVTVLAAKKDKQTGEFIPTNPQSPMDVLYYDEDDCFWVTGIGLVLDKDANTYPKAQFTYLIRFIRRDSQVELHVGPERKRFFIKLKDPEGLVPDEETMNPIFDYMVGSLRETLSLRLWDAPLKGQIGFVELGQNQGSGN